MHRRLVGVLAASTLGALAFATPGHAGSDYRNKYPTASDSRDCGDGDTVDYLGPLKLWPPNHKLQEVAVSATGAGPSALNETTLAVTPGVTDAAGGDGGPQHDPDWVPGDNGFTDAGSPTATVPFSLRAERSGKGDGRTYTISWDATFHNGAKHCSSSDSGQSPFTVTVPHDMSGGADWK